MDTPLLNSADPGAALQHPIELLAPAGNWDCARAAVENGADAIYFGLDVGFNARARAANFHLDELKPLMKMLHRQRVCGYVTLNTLVFTDELPSLEENVRHLAAAGVDAVLVQDLGVAKLIREICPQLAIHASTQMTLTNAAAINMAAELGVERAVLARELSLAEIRKIAKETKMPLEVFVHGALCVAYSGQCLTSESFGGRSANRGQCAQACRLPYNVYCDDELKDLKDVKYLLSPQDLAAHDLVPQLLDAGVCSLKIEGRLKTPEYVANVCSHYRAAIDDALIGRQRRLTDSQTRELELSFSRGFSPGWLEGCDHKRLVPGLSSAKRGTLIGQVVELQGDMLIAKLESPLALGDGIVIEGDRAAGEEVGGRVYSIDEKPTGNQTSQDSEHGVFAISLGRGNLRDKQLPSGLKIWKTDDPQLTKRLRKSFDSRDPRKRVAIDLNLKIEVGKPIELEARLGNVSVQVAHEHLPELARKHAVTEERLHEQFSRLGGTVYKLRTLTAKISGQPMVPLSILGAMRKQLVDKLDAENVPKSRECAESDVAAKLLAPAKAASPATASPEGDVGTAKLRVLARSLTQLKQLLAADVRDVIADFHDLREYKQAIEMARLAGASIELATLRIHKPGEDGLFHALRKLTPDAWLVRSLAAMAYCQQNQIPFACDFSLNVTNPLTAEQLLQWGAQRITASYDLNRDQLFELGAEMPSAWMEVVIHQHMPMFHMEHCVFCSILSPGKNKSDCGRPCDRHEVKLEDRVGAKHVLHADIGCRNTLYNATAQSGAEAVKPLLELGVRDFRVELLKDASEEETTQLISLYRRLVAGDIAAPDVWKQLKAQNRVGVTRGTLEHPRNPLAII